MYDPNASPAARRPAGAAVSAALLATVLLSPPAPAGDPNGAGAAGGGWKTKFSPAGDLYPGYVADLHRLAFAVSTINVSDGGYADSGDSLLYVRVGGRYGFARFHPDSDPDLGIQIDAEGGFVALFDQDNSTDSIGWDGLFGVQVAWAPTRKLAARFGIFHDSSHVGDEYAERTGRVRIDYTRNELAFGVSFRLGERWRTYLDGGYGYDLRNQDVMDPWRARTGVEFKSRPRLWRERIGWYAAADLSAFQEDDWSGNLSVQAGLVRHVPELSRSYRFGLEYYDGRSPIGEFFQDDVTQFGFGFCFTL